MTLDNVRQFQKSAFFIPRYTDKELVGTIRLMARDGGYKLEKATYYFTFSDQQAELSGDQQDSQLEELLAIDTIATRQMAFFSEWLLTNHH